MIEISYLSAVIFISIVWCLVRVLFAIKNKGIQWKREVQLILVYVCIIVVARFTFFPFFKVNGEIQPLVFEAAKAFPFRINLVPFVNLFDYPSMKDILINVIGNTTMFMPIGVIYPIVYKKLNTAPKVLLAGIGLSLCIEILQLPFYDRVTDIDDLLLNSIGFSIGYFVYVMVKKIGRGIVK